MEMYKDGGLVIDTDGMEWRTLAPGVGIKVLRLDRESGAWTIMIRSEKGSVLPPHRHIGNSEIYIIKGMGHHEQAGHFKTGDYVLEPNGATHSPLFFVPERRWVTIVHAGRQHAQRIRRRGSSRRGIRLNRVAGLAPCHEIAHGPAPDQAQVHERILGITRR